jgi:uncharacterized protein YcbK (DUF882 family)
VGNLTKNISRHELACNCGCNFDSMDFETINVVQESCDHFAKKLGVNKVVLHINSAARCLKYNRSIGSTDKSMHTKARAIDYTIDEVSPDELHAYLIDKYDDTFGIGQYDDFTHLDTRSIKARW